MQRRVAARAQRVRRWRAMLGNLGSEFLDDLSCGGFVEEVEEREG